jgi:membrane-bound ClpP family serine protease
VGIEGVAKTDITPDGGMAIVHGEYWSAYSDNVIQQGARVIVEDVRGLRVKVKKSNL